MRVTDLLRTMDIFEALASEELETIAQLLRERRLAESEVLCRQGDPGDALFIVTGGRIRLSTTDPSGNEKILTYFTDGQFFGEMSLLTGSPRSATASAETDSQVLVLDKHSFDQLLAGHAQIMREMLKVVSQRTLQTNQQLLADEPGNSFSQGAGRVYAIFSPRGGSGKTTLAVNLAAQLAHEQPERTALLDLSLTFGHTSALLGLQPETSLAASSRYRPPQAIFAPARRRSALLVTMTSTRTRVASEGDGRMPATRDGLPSVTTGGRCVVPSWSGVQGA